MEKQKIIEEFQNYQNIIGKIDSFYRINEALCHFFESSNAKFYSYGLVLSSINSALVCWQHSLCSILLCRNKESKNIPCSIDRILSEGITNDKNKVLYNKIVPYLKELQKIINQESDNIEKLRNFRNNVYAHFNKKIFNEEWQIEYKVVNNFDFVKLREACLRIFDNISAILEILGAETFEKSIVLQRDIKKFIEKLD